MRPVTAGIALRDCRRSNLCLGRLRRASQRRGSLLSEVIKEGKTREVNLRGLKS